MGLSRFRRTGNTDSMDILWPSHVRLFPHYAEVGAQRAKSYTVVGYPRTVQPGWMEPLLGFPHPLTLAIHSAPIATDEVVQSMNRRMIWSRGSTDADQKRGRLARAEQLVALEDAEQARFGLARGETRMLEVGMTLTLWAESDDELERIGRILESLAQGMMLVLRPLQYQQLLGLRRNLPLGEPVDKVREMDSRAWATLFPFSSRDLVHAHGQVFGVNTRSRSFVIVDRFQLSSPHSITVGWSGAGKSFAAKLEALRARYRGLAVSVIDPEGEYRALSRAGAHIWNLGEAETGSRQGTEFPFDPFSVQGELGPDELDRQCDFLLRFLNRLDSGLMEEFGGIVRDGLWRAARLVESGKFSPRGGADRDLVEHWTLLVGEESGRAKERLNLLYERWVRMAGRTPHHQSEPFEVFDVSRMAPGMRGAVYLALTEWIMRRMGRESGRRLVIFDESWHLLTDDSTAPYLEELFRRARKWECAVSLISQDIGDFTRSRAASVCLHNAPLVMLLRQHPDSLAEAQKILHLHDGEMEQVANAGVGEGLLLLHDDHLPFRVVASKREIDLVAAREEGLSVDVHH